MRYLVDTSAFVRFQQALVGARVQQIPGRDLLVSLPLKIEVGFGAQTAAEHQARMELLDRFNFAEASAWAQHRAVTVQALLAERGQHRSARLGDLLTAAVAEQHDLTVLHYDRDFDTIAAVTGQSMEWVVPAGTAD